MPRYGIDTSIFVRLLTGDPADGYMQTKAALEVMINEQAASFEVSNLVIAEAYFVLQHYYGVAKGEASAAIALVLTSGLVAPVLGWKVITALRETAEPGLLDRLIVSDYAASGLLIVTNDKKMSRLPGTHRL